MLVQFETRLIALLILSPILAVKIDYSGYGLSDHARIVCDLKIQKHQIDNRTEIKYRNIKLIDLNVFSPAFMADMVFDDCISSEEMVHRYNTCLIKLLDQHAPLVRKSHLEGDFHGTTVRLVK